MSLTKAEIEEQIELLESQEASLENKKLLLEAYFAMTRAEVRMSNQQVLLNFSDKGIGLAKELGDEIALGRFHITKSKYFNNQLKFSLCRQELEVALEIFKNTEHCYEWGSCYLGIGLSYRGEFKWNKGITYLFKAANLLNKHANKDSERALLAAIYCNIGLSYGQLKLTHKAIQYQLDALKIAEENDIVYHKGRFLTYLGREHIIIKDYEKALFYTQQACTVFTELGLPNEQAFCYQNFANIHKEMGNVEEGLKNLFVAYKLAEESETEMIIRVNRETICEFLEEFMLKTDSAWPLIEQYVDFEDFALNLLAKMEKVGQMSFCYKMNLFLAEYYKRQVNWEKAFDHERSANKISQKIYEEEQQQLIANEQAKMELHKKEVELNLQKDLLEKEIAANQKLKELNNRIQEKNQIISSKAEELEEINRELENFAFITSHDLKEPLRSMDSFLSLLKLEYYDALDKAGKDYINFTMNGAARIRKLIEDLLSYTKLSNQELTFESCDLNAIAQKALSRLSNQKEESKIEVEILGALPTIIANIEMVEILFLNIIENAIKYRRTQPKLTITNKKEGEYCILSFMDNGIGIDADFQKKIFDIFKRLHNKDQYTGTGIGLSLCKKIVGLHNGSIDLESEEGKGSTFFVKLPFAQ